MTLAEVKEVVTINHLLPRLLLRRQTRRRPLASMTSTTLRTTARKKRKLTAIQQLNDITTLQHEALNKLSERSYACQYPMKVHTSSGKYIDTIALIDITGDNSSN